ncbi:hypothetical protein [Nocardia paucivorans]|uniref:hypothetical protein n=1 Tax=Nocardia paucivorans TaxID=114259 RepID=UPI000319719E|nr:hypothetical protein [Nocardia paucivorans]
MKKFAVYGIGCVATATLMLSGAGVASATDTPVPSTGSASGSSSQTVLQLVKILSTGSFAGGGVIGR